LNDQPDTTRRLLKRLLDIAETSDYLVGGSVGEFAVGEEIFQIPRFIFMGPTGGGDTVRLGIFGGFHGDEPESAEALIAFLEELDESPQLANGYHIYVYPLCNPSGFVARTRGNASAEDLTKQFWNGSSQSEIYYLEREMGVLRLHGVFSVQTQSDSGGFLVNTKSRVLNRALAHPAIQASRRFLPGNVEKSEALPGDIRPTKPRDLPDFLSATDELNPVPFELHIGIPKSAPKPSQIHGTIGALKSILDSYRSLLAISQNL
jgi:hypothetical protein